MKDFFVSWLKTMVLTLLFIGSISIIIIPTILMNNMIDNERISHSLSISWAFFSGTFFTTFIFKMIFNKNK